jgi:hypothetical protein
LGYFQKLHKVINRPNGENSTQSGHPVVVRLSRMNVGALWVLRKYQSDVENGLWQAGLAAGGAGAKFRAADAAEGVAVFAHNLRPPVDAGGRGREVELEADGARQAAGHGGTRVPSENNFVLVRELPTSKCFEFSFDGFAYQQQDNKKQTLADM